MMAPLWGRLLGLGCCLPPLPCCSGSLEGLHDASALVQAAVRPSAAGFPTGDDDPLHLLKEQLQRFAGPEGAIERKLLDSTMHNIWQQVHNQSNASAAQALQMMTGASLMGVPLGLPVADVRAQEQTPELQPLLASAPQRLSLQEPTPQQLPQAAQEREWRVACVSDANRALRSGRLDTEAFRATIKGCVGK
mmetsp:Transcript_32580/g.89858  ORF Transcript_32580/g.89858 Transcript_32580/m.89858 type:complete len:192 (-) Transcript_32580:218-793(-)